MTHEDYYRILFGPDFPGFISIWEKQSKTTKFFNTSEIAKMIRYIKSIQEKCDVYVGCGLRADKHIAGRGKSEAIIAIPGLWLDIDLLDPVAHKAKHLPATNQAAYKILKRFPLPPTIVNWSGYGLHLYWLFKNLWVFQNEDERNEARDLSKRFQDTIIAIFKDEGYQLDYTADLARVLRAPGTLNHKKDPAVPVKILRIKDEQTRRYTIDEIREVVDSKRPPKSRMLKPISKNTVIETGPYSGSKVEQILQKCQWFRHCQTDSASLSEPEWFFMLTIAAFCEKPLSWAYELSKDYDGFDQKETRDKVVRIRRTWTRPVTCDYISQNLGGDYCEECPHIVRSPFELGIDKSSSALENIGFGFNDDGKVKWLNGNMFARYILQRLKLIYTESDSFYEYYDGVWNHLKHNELSRKLRDLVHEFAPDFWTTGIEQNYLEALKREAPNKTLNPDRNVINLKNGVLDLSTFKFKSHRPSYFSSIQLPISYDEDAVCPKFDKFLNDIFDGDTERIRVIEEVMGYCLTADTSAQKAFFFYGQGSNGKSLLADIILTLCGVQNTSAIPLEDLQNAFNRYELVDKLLNMTTENEISPAGLNTAPFKTIVSGDPIQVEKKYEQSFMYRPFCKLIFSLNSLPYSRDRSWGFQRRLIVIPFNHTFRVTDPDYQNYNVLRDGLLQELPGILNLALGALKRLRENNYVFSPSKAIRVLQKDYKQLLNPYAQFVEEVIAKGDATDKISNDVMHRVFETWCRANGHDKLAKGSHLRRILQIRTALAEAQIPYTAGKGCKAGGKRYTKGITLRERNLETVSDISEVDV